MKEKTEIVISDSDDCFITLLHYPDDPASWIVRKWERRLLWKKRALSRWFNTRDLAEQFARLLVRECGKAKMKDEG